MHNVFEGTLQVIFKTTVVIFDGRNFLQLTHWMRESSNSTMGHKQQDHQPGGEKNDLDTRPRKLKKKKTMWIGSRLHIHRNDIPDCFSLQASDEVKDVALIGTGSFVPEGDKKLENYLDLMTIVDYIFTPVTTPDKCSYLKFKIEEFLSRFR